MIGRWSSLSATGRAARAAISRREGAMSEIEEEERSRLFETGARDARLGVYIRLYSSQFRKYLEKSVLSQCEASSLGGLQLRTRCTTFLIYMNTHFLGKEGWHCLSTPTLTPSGHQLLGNTFFCIWPFRSWHRRGDGNADV